MMEKGDPSFFLSDNFDTLKTITKKEHSLLVS